MYPQSSAAEETSIVACPCLSKVCTRDSSRNRRASPWRTGTTSSRVARSAPDGARRDGVGRDGAGSRRCGYSGCRRSPRHAFKGRDLHLPSVCYGRRARFTLTAGSPTPTNPGSARCQAEPPAFVSGSRILSKPALPLYPTFDYLITSRQAFFAGDRLPVRQPGLRRRRYSREQTDAPHLRIRTRDAHCSWNERPPAWTTGHDPAHRSRIALNGQRPFQLWLPANGAIHQKRLAMPRLPIKGPTDMFPGGRIGLLLSMYNSLNPGAKTNSYWKACMFALK